MTTRARTTCEKWCVHSDVELNQLRCSGSSSTATSAERRGTAAPARQHGAVRCVVLASVPRDSQLGHVEAEANRQRLRTERQRRAPGWD